MIVTIPIPTLRLSSRRRVRRGIHFMDKHVSRDVWLPRIDLDELEVATSQSCPLAQATGLSFWQAARRFGLGDGSTYLSALRCANLGFLAYPRESYVDLNVEWLRQLTTAQRDSVSVR